MLAYRKCICFHNEKKKKKTVCKPFNWKHSIAEITLLFFNWDDVDCVFFFFKHLFAGLLNLCLIFNIAVSYKYICLIFLLLTIDTIRLTQNIILIRYCSLLINDYKFLKKDFVVLKVNSNRNGKNYFLSVQVLSQMNLFITSIFLLALNNKYII